jgi:hypothetical protein
MLSSCAKLKMIDDVVVKVVEVVKIVIVVKVVI